MDLGNKLMQRRTSRVCRSHLFNPAVAMPSVGICSDRSWILVLCKPRAGRLIDAKLSLSCLNRFVVWDCHPHQRLQYLTSFFDFMQTLRSGRKAKSQRYKTALKMQLI